MNRPNKKRLVSDMQGGGFIEIRPKSYKSPKKPYIESKSIKQYRLERDRLIWKLHPESRKEIEEYYKSRKL